MKKGMLRTILSLALVLMLALTPGMSLAAQPVFGDLTGRAMSDAWALGRGINTELSLSLGKLTGTGLDDEESQKAMAAVSQLLDIAAINVSAVKIENGLRMEANAELSDQEIISGAVEITPELIAAETNVLPGKRLIVSVDDVKTMLGMQELTEEQVAAMLGMVEAYLTDAAARYGAVLSDWAEDTVEVVEGAGTEATETCDAITCTHTVTVTGSELKALAVALIDEALADQTLISVLNSLGLTDDEGNAIDVSAELAAAKADVEADTEFDPLRLIFVQGINEEKGMTVCAYVRLTYDGEPGALLAKAECKTDVNGGYVATVTMGFNDGESDLMTYDYVVSYAWGENDSQLTSVNGTMVMEDGYQTTMMDLSADGVVTIAENSETSTVNENMRMVIESGDGESYTRDNMDMMLGMSIATNDLGDDFNTVFAYEAGVEGNIGGEVMEMLLGMGVTISSGEYVPSTEPLTDVDVLTLDEAGMEALSAEAEAGLMQVAFSALSLLPQDLLAMFMTAE